MQQVTIETPEPRNGRRGRREKTRSFQVTLLGWIRCDRLVGASDKGSHRPAWFTYAGPEQEARAFTANVLGGHTFASFGHTPTRWSITKKGYTHHSRKVAGGLITTVYQPDLFRADPGMVDSLVRFILVQPRSWFEQQKKKHDADFLARARDFVARTGLRFDNYVRYPLPSVEEDLENLLPEAMLFLMYLDRRIPYPMIPDPLFALQILVRCFNERLAVRSQSEYRSSYEEHGFSDLGLRPGLCFSADRESFGPLVAEEVLKWHA